MRRLAKQLKSEQLLVVYAQGVEMIGGLLFFKLLTVYLTKAELGNYLLATSVMSLILVASFSVMDQGLMRFVSIYETQGKLSEMYSAYLLGFFILVIIFGMFFLCLSALIGFETRWGSILIGLMFWILTEPIKNAALAMSNATRDRKVIAKTKVLEQFLRSGLVLAVALLFSMDSSMVLILLSLSGVCVSAILLWWQRVLLGTLRKDNIRKVFVDAIGFSWPLFLWGIFGWLQQMSNRWLLEIFYSEQEVANFGVLALLVTLPFTMILGLVGAYALPIIYQIENTSPGSARAKVTIILRKLAPLLVGIVLILSIFGREIVVLVATPDYLENAWLLPIMATGVALSSLGTVMTYKDFAMNQTRRLILPNVLPGIFALVSGLILVPSYGVAGAAASFVLANTLYCFLQWFTFVRR